jgi:DNA polymerase-3 subunit delta'
MSEDIDPRETDLHPRRNPRLIGHDEAEGAVLAGWASGKLHHAWLIGGPRGIGKATLAYRIARFLFAHPASPAPGSPLPHNLAVSGDHPAFRHMAARSLPDLLVIEAGLDPKKKGHVRGEISIEEARKATEFFARTAAGGGWRVAIVDAADDLNRNAANALLKIIEEPPARTVFLIVAHSPGRLLATIRSRCRRLELLPLSASDEAEVLKGLPGLDGARPDAIDDAIDLSGGSPGRALEMLDSEAANAFAGFQALMAAPEGRPGDKLQAIAARLAERENIEDYHLFSSLVGDWVARRAVAEARAGHERLARRWAEVHAGIGHSLREANTLNLDRRETLLRALATITTINGSGHDPR